MVTHRIPPMRAFPVTSMSSRGMGRASGKHSRPPGCTLGARTPPLPHRWLCRYWLEPVVHCPCAHAKQGFALAYEEHRGVNASREVAPKKASRPASGRGQGPVQGTHPVRWRVPVSSRAQCMSFQGCLSLSGPGGWHGVSTIPRSRMKGLHEARPPNVT